MNELAAQRGNARIGEPETPLRINEHPAPESAPVTTATGVTAEVARKWDRVDVGVVLGLVFLALSISTLAVVRAPSLSAYDEITHIDYSWKVAHGTAPYAGALLAPEIREEWSCRGQDNAVGMLPPCGEGAPAEAYPARGENYNWIHPPLYYGITGVIASVVHQLPLDLTFVTAARLTGGVWLAAALAGLYLVLRIFGIGRLTATTAAVLLAAVPSLAHASSIVTNDAPAALAGVLALWVLARITVQDRLGWGLPTGLTVFVAGMKVMHSVAMLAVAGVVLVLALAAFRRGESVRARALGLVTVGIVGATCAVQLGWTAVQASRAVPGWINPVKGVNTNPVLGNPVGEWLPTLFSGFGITDTFWLQDSVYSFAVLASARLLALIFTAAPFMNVTAFAAGDSRRLVGWSAIVGCAAVPLLVQLQAYFSGHDYFPNISGRYGLSLLPMTIAAIACVAQARRWRVATVLLGAFSIGALLVTFTGFLVTP